MPDRPLILIVEDDDDIRTLVADYLQGCEYRVVADVNLRGGNGYDLAQLARTMDIPILLISGEPKTIERHQGDFVEFMQKPFRLADLHAKIREMIIHRP
jgi:DNA-binding response OmpR family regulator